MGNFPVKVGNKNGIDTYVATLTNGEEQLLITRDGKQYLSKGDGTKIEVSDVIVVDTLPENNIQSNKIYILKEGVNYSLHYYDTQWRILSSSIGIDDTNLSTTSTYSSDKIISLINNQGDYNTSYSYNGAGKINGYTITGDKTENVTYTYFTSGDNLGKIETETIIKDGKTLVNTFSYTNGKISGVITVTN